MNAPTPGPCKDCGAPSIDGFWCQDCHDAANAELEDYYREHPEPCGFLKRFWRLVKDARNA